MNDQTAKICFCFLISIAATIMTGFAAYTVAACIKAIIGLFS